MTMFQVTEKLIEQGFFVGCLAMAADHVGEVWRPRGSGDTAWIYGWSVKCASEAGHV